MLMLQVPLMLGLPVSYIVHRAVLDSAGPLLTPMWVSAPPPAQNRRICPTVFCWVILSGLSCNMQHVKK
jgi:hypothetical protein